jgi:hypothetical protein
MGRKEGRIRADGSMAINHKASGRAMGKTVSGF